MLTSISPLGERARHNRWGVTAGAYVIGSVGAAAVIGAALGALGALAGAPLAVRAALLAAGAVVALLVDTGLIPLPTIRRQVDEDWLNRYRGWVYGAGFGGQLGAGVVTIVTTATVYLVLLAELVAGSVGAGAIIGAAFGALRAAPLLTGGQVRDYSQLVARHRRLIALAPASRRATWTVTAVAAAVLIAVTIGRLQ
jgi:presenilin-like A22 family membrane protease